MSEKFSYSSDVHPILTSEMLFRTNSISDMLSTIDSPIFHEKINTAGVKYIVIPIDVWKRIFLIEYKFDIQAREKLILALKQNKFQQDMSYTNLAVFINPSFQFTSYKPKSVQDQEYWMKRGLFITALSLCMSILIIVKYRKSDS